MKGTPETPPRELRSCVSPKIYPGLKGGWFGSLRDVLAEIDHAKWIAHLPIAHLQMNADSMQNYGKRYRAGQRNGTGLPSRSF
jgi:hypothetical protein